MENTVYIQKAEAIISRITAIEEYYYPNDNIEVIDGFIVDPNHKHPDDSIYNIIVDLELLLFKLNALYPSLYEIRIIKKSEYNLQTLDIYSYPFERERAIFIRSIANKFIDFMKDE